MWSALTEVRGTGCLLAPTDLEEALSKRGTSLSRAKAVVLSGGRQGGRGTYGRLFTHLTDLFNCILREQKALLLYGRYVHTHCYTSTIC